MFSRIVKARADSTHLFEEFLARVICEAERVLHNCNNLVDPASSHMLVSKIKPCMSQYKLSTGEAANGSLKQLSFIW